jgi:predicted ABC-type ATPase
MLTPPDGTPLDKAVAHVSTYQRGGKPVKGYDRSVHDALVHALAKKMSERVAAAPDTRALYTMHGSTDAHPLYVPSRERLHQAIVSGILDHINPEAGGRPVAILTGGGSASGKGCISKPLREPRKDDFAWIDSDEIKAKLPEFQQKEKAGDHGAASYVHAESCDVVSNAIDGAIAKNVSFVYDNTMSNPASVKTMIDTLHAHGYYVRVLYADLPVEKALERAKKRGEQTGRYVPEDIIRSIHAGCLQTLSELSGLADRVDVYSTDVPMGAPAKFVYHRDAHMKTVDADELAQLQARGGLLKALGGVALPDGLQDFLDMLAKTRVRDEHFEPIQPGCEDGCVDLGDFFAKAIVNVKGYQRNGRPVKGYDRNMLLRGEREDHIEQAAHNFENTGRHFVEHYGHALQIAARLAHADGQTLYITKSGKGGFYLSREAPLIPGVTGIGVSPHGVYTLENHSSTNGKSVTLTRVHAMNVLKSASERPVKVVNQAEKAAGVALALAPVQPKGVTTYGSTPGSASYASIPVGSLNVDPHAYQFKASDPTSGENGRLASVTKWDAQAGLMNPIMVHERLDGSLWVVDGHQRVGLAKRLVKEGHAPDSLALNAVVFKESDGYTVPDMLKAGALANIRQGTGSALDIAKILRNGGFTDEEKATIPKGSNEQYQDAEALASMSPEAFTYLTTAGICKDGARNARYGAIVARKLSDPKQQLEAMQVLRADPPAGREECEDIVSELADSGFTETHTQANLFGEQVIAQNLAKPMAEIKASVRRLLEGEKSALGNAMRNKERLEKQGNVLNTAGNQAGYKAADTLAGILKEFGNRQGGNEVKDALKEIARSYSHGDISRQRAADQTVQALDAFYAKFNGGQGSGGVPASASGSPETLSEAAKLEAKPQTPLAPEHVAAVERIADGLMHTVQQAHPALSDHEVVTQAARALDAEAATVEAPGLRAAVAHAITHMQTQGPIEAAPITQAKAPVAQAAQDELYRLSRAHGEMSDALYADKPGRIKSNQDPVDAEKHRLIAKVYQRVGMGEDPDAVVSEVKAEASRGARSINVRMEPGHQAMREADRGGAAITDNTAHAHEKGWLAEIESAGESAKAVLKHGGKGWAAALNAEWGAKKAAHASPAPVTQAKPPESRESLLERARAATAPEGDMKARVFKLRAPELREIAQDPTHSLHEVAKAELSRRGKPLDATPKSTQKPGAQPENQNAVGPHDKTAESYRAAHAEMVATKDALDEASEELDEAVDTPDEAAAQKAYDQAANAHDAATDALKGVTPAVDKGHVKAVKAVFPKASADDLTDPSYQNGAPRFAVGEDWEKDDGILGEGPTEAHAWADAAAKRAKAPQVAPLAPVAPVTQATPQPVTQAVTQASTPAPDGVPPVTSFAAKQKLKTELGVKLTATKQQLANFIKTHGMEAMFGGRQQEALALQDTINDLDQKLYRVDHPEKPQTGDFVDVGVKMGGARKDTWRKVESGDATYSTIDWEALDSEPGEAERVVTRANLLAHSTPQAMQDAGMPSGVAYLVHHALGTIATKPGVDSNHARRIYAKGVERVQRALMGARSFQNVVDTLKQFRTEASGYYATPEETAHRDALRATYDAARVTLRAAEPAAKAAYAKVQAADNALMTVKYNRRLKDEAKKTAMMAPLEEARKVAAAEWSPLQGEVNKLQEAASAAYSPYHDCIDALTKKDHANPESWHQTFGMLGDRFEAMLKGKGAVWDKHNDHAQRRIKEGDWSWAEKDEEGKPRAAVAKRDTGLPEWERYSPETDERHGGADVGTPTSEELRQKHGFKAIEYGNWVTPSERAHHTKRAAEALTDLSDALGIAPEQVSYGGRLGLALGARGHGKALAHYESRTKAINITKEGGGGSLAHEWGHFLDNILAQVSHEGNGGHSSFASHGAGAQGPHMPPEVASAMKEVRAAMQEGDVMPTQVIAPGTSKYRAFPLLDTMIAKYHGDGQATFDALKRGEHNNSSQMGLRVGKLSEDWAKYIAAKTGQHVVIPVAGPGSSEFVTTAHAMGKYWARPHEMFARAWESYVQDKLEAKGIRNSYLVSGTNEDVDWRHQGSRKASSFVYPQGVERARTNAAFDHLIAAIKDTGMLQKALDLAAGHDEIFPLVHQDPDSGQIL